MNIKHIFTIALSCLAFVSCSNIAEDERLVYVEPASSQRSVLIEDFTGQRCVNCPKATDAIHEIQDLYGDDGVIAVAIHCGPFGFKGNAKTVGLATELGDTYWNQWFDASQGQPVAKINRGAKTEDYASWGGEVAKAMEQTTQVSIWLSNTYDGNGNLTINTILSSAAGTKGNLQLWLIEDGIVALQLQPDGSQDKNYVHNHVLRAAINGEWGEPVTFTENNINLTHTYAIPAEYKAENCSVVAFVYDDNGVQQVVKARVIE